MGTGAQRTTALRALRALSHAASKSQPRAVVMSYTQLLIHHASFCTSGNHVDLLVADEAHTMKGEHTATKRAFASIPARARVLLSATVVQNDWEELHSLADLAVPGGWMPREHFTCTIGDPLRAAAVKGAPHGVRMCGALARARLHALKAPLMLRRTTSDVHAGVPTPHVHAMLLEMTLLSLFVGRFSWVNVTAGEESGGPLLARQPVRIQNPQSA